MFAPGKNPVGHIESLPPPFMLIGKVTEGYSIRHDVLKISDLEKIDEGRVVGRLILDYFPQKAGADRAMNEVRIRRLEIHEHHRRRGIARGIVQLLPELPLPVDFISQAPIDHVSTRIPERPEVDEEFTRFWEALEAEKIVRRAPHHRYQLLKGINEQIG